MTRPYRKPKYRLDPKKFELAVEKEKKEQDWGDGEVFNEVLREKSRRRH